DGAELTYTLPVERTIEGRYQLENLLGKGGMGAVYEATDLRIKRRVAVKILSGAMFGNREALRRFEREAQTAGRLQHPHIVSVFDYGVLPTAGAFLVMELVRGETLRAVLARARRLDPDTAVAWFGQILDGVGAAHRAGVVHRDLKPENVLVSGDGAARRLRVSDFGLARAAEQDLAGSVTLPGTILGTFGYMSPEQLRGEPADERSDLFSVGVMLYEALSGEKPFRGDSYHELLYAMTGCGEAPFANDYGLADFFQKALVREASSRFVSAEEMKRHLFTSRAESERGGDA
ncbi:MAG TPA: serine/threonine-protein kinase, partial [Pyrinomonadaceae bacterium]|nr:serine/threonine-protein kinase [Pyrinomonadaceae bacterium]